MHPVIKAKRLIFPLVNAIIMGVLIGLVGYYLLNPIHWMLVGMGIGLILGLIVELSLGLLGGWVYRRRLVFGFVLDLVLSIGFIGPFILFYTETTPIPHPVCCIADSGLGDAVEEVRIPVADGEVLAGWYAPPTNGNGAVILVLHGTHGDRTSSLPHARILHDAGYGVLVYDQRALGESTGSRCSLGLYDQRDITPILDWLSARPEVNMEKIGGVGLSLGAHILLRAAPSEPRLKAIWSDGLGINGVEDLPVYDSAAEKLSYFVSRQAYWLTGLYLGERFIPVKRLLPQLDDRFIMLVAGGEDPYEEGYHRGYLPYLGNEGSLWVVKNAGHVGGIYTEPEQYRRRMITFFDDALR